MITAVLRTSVPVVAGALAVSFYAATFTVHQTQQALVLQFGRVRDVISEPGLHFKWPFIEGVVTIGCRHVRRSRQRVAHGDHARPRSYSDATTRR